MRVLGAFFGLIFLAGVFFLMRRDGAEVGRLEAAFAFGLMAIAVLGWTIQLIVEVIDRSLRAWRRRGRS